MVSKLVIQVLSTNVNEWNWILVPQKEVNEQNLIHNDLTKPITVRAWFDIFKQLPSFVCL